MGEPEAGNTTSTERIHVQVHETLPPVQGRSRFLVSKLRDRQRIQVKSCACSKGGIACAHCNRVQLERKSATSFFEASRAHASATFTRLVKRVTCTQTKGSRTPKCFSIVTGSSGEGTHLFIDACVVASIVTVCFTK